ncbi:long-chain-fatty-acid--CoA ligase [Uliginosibacterium sp. 31-16]|uniref:long-chain-fatty-acid--CoA ligase n=1 Tax=Uliginosibacterium sp. 31-16 TaxID=3068315 RepID=UPI00273D13E8|nr:long-chain-fatty-acid--CoA ligase [Uliginosibacterium sp. 31-16]MDP5238506.1 long-chain-fatty-acid--CoA ligase [Uliginosibacterium sp. 31-16]
MKKTWLESYPPGVPAEIDPARYSSVVAIFEESCKRFSNKTAYISMGASMSYAELDRQSRNFAAWLQSTGVQRGSRVALMMPNLLQYPVCLFGALRAGCTIVNCNPLYTAPELEHQLQDSGAEVIVIVENFAHTLQKIVANTAVRHVVTTSLGEMLGVVKGRVVNYVVRKVKKMVPTWQLPGSISLAAALRAGRAREFNAPQLSHQDIAFLQYTGGTTGISKGAMLTHRNIVANVLQADAWIDPVIKIGEEFIVTALPLYHIFALTANCLTFLRLGATNLLIVNPRDIPGFVKELGRYRFTAITGVNTLFNALLANPDFAKLNFSSLRLTLGGGMAVMAPVAEKWRQVTGVPLVQAYGLTETSPAVCINPFTETGFSGSIGLPISSTEVSIRDDDGEVEAGKSGEICVRGPQVMAGYFKRPGETANVFHADGFLKTGDIGYIDDKGFVFLVDRKKDMILVSGFNVYPNEVEAVVAMIPAVQDVACIGVPDARSGEAVKIFVVRSDPRLTAAMIIEHCHTQLTGYKVPHHVEFREDLPRTNVGKILRRALREGVPS